MKDLFTENFIVIEIIKEYGVAKFGSCLQCESAFLLVYNNLYSTVESL